MIKVDNKSNAVLKKLERIEELIELLKIHYENNIEFDNTNPNHYKLIVWDKSFEFGTYNDVISALEFTCASELMIY